MGLFTELKERYARRLGYRNGTLVAPVGNANIRVKKEKMSWDVLPSRRSKERRSSRRSSYGSQSSEQEEQAPRDETMKSDRHRVRTKSEPSVKIENVKREEGTGINENDEYVLVDELPEPSPSPKNGLISPSGEDVLPKSRDELAMFILRYIVTLARENSPSSSPSNSHNKRAVKKEEEGDGTMTVRASSSGGLPITSMRIMHELRALMRDTGSPKEVAQVFSDHAVYKALCELNTWFHHGIEFDPLHDVTLMKPPTSTYTAGEQTTPTHNIYGGILTKVDVTILSNYASGSLDLSPIVPKIMSRKRTLAEEEEDQMLAASYSKKKSKPFPAIPTGDHDVEGLINVLSARQKLLFEAGEELRELLYCPTVMQSRLAKKFVNKHRTAQEFCTFGSRVDCRNASRTWTICGKIHFRKLTNRWTDEMLGDCSYLDTCRHMATCKFVHYTLDLSQAQVKTLEDLGIENCGTDTKRFNEVNLKGIDFPPQWLQCDVRTLDLSIFQGIVSVIMADPPWDIHMELPYGTMTDDEMRNLKLQNVQTDGMIFLWVTGRASELARECLNLWGYKRVEEIIWVKTNQLQRIIRTGRTGHWINHSKEHCLVGIKGNPVMNRNLDCDVIVSEVRETSRKPDEVYNLIERMFPNTLKVELFGRPHNVHTNWITLGNQLDGNRICHEELAKRYNNKYPDSPVVPFSREEALKLSENAKKSASADSNKQAPSSRRNTIAGVPAAIENGPWRPPEEAKTKALKESEPWRPPIASLPLSHDISTSSSSSAPHHHRLTSTGQALAGPPLSSVLPPTAGVPTLGPRRAPSLVLPHQQPPPCPPPLPPPACVPPVSMPLLKPGGPIYAQPPSMQQQAMLGAHQAPPMAQQGMPRPSGGVMPPPRPAPTRPPCLHFM